MRFLQTFFALLSTFVMLLLFTGVCSYLTYLGIVKTHSYEYFKIFPTKDLYVNEIFWISIFTIINFVTPLFFLIVGALTDFNYKLIYTTRTVKQMDYKLGLAGITLNVIAGMLDNKVNGKDNDLSEEERNNVDDAINILKDTIK